MLGVPALVDNLAVVYNKDLFAKAGIPEPTGDWTWDDLRAAAKAITDPANKVFGLAFPADGSETTVWEYEAMLWAAGGEILNSDNTQGRLQLGGGRSRAARRSPTSTRTARCTSTSSPTPASPGSCSTRARSG